MPCPRCGGPLETYRLRDRETPVCPDCGFVDSAVSHEREGRNTESWTAALERFRERHGADRGADGLSVTDGDQGATE
jgi:uncharacterized Zn finger protein (UPF0148 family)